MNNSWPENAVCASHFLRMATIYDDGLLKTETATSPKPIVDVDKDVFDDAVIW